MRKGSEGFSGTQRGFFYTGSLMTHRRIGRADPIQVGLFSRPVRTASLWLAGSGWVLFFGFVVALVQADANESVGVVIQALPDAVEVVSEEEPAEVVTAPVSEAEVAYRAGMEAGKKNDYARARVLMEKALRLQPDYGKADLALGVILIVLGEREEGQARIQRIAALPLPIASDAHTLLANEASKEGRYEDVAKHYAQAIEITPDNIVLYVKLGKSLIAQSRFEEAIPILEAAVALHPRAGAAWLNLGRALLHLDRPSDAELRFRRVLEIDERNLHATWYLARLVAGRDQKEEANALYEEAAKWAAQRRQAELVIRIRAEQQSL